MTDYRMDQTLTLGPVTLTVADLERSVRYYTQAQASASSIAKHSERNWACRDGCWST